MAPTDNTTATGTGDAPYWMNYSTTSGTIRWVETAPDGDGSWRGAYLDSRASYDYNRIPSDLEDKVLPIQGEPKGAKYLISYAFKKAKDPVVFLKSRQDMIKMVQALWNDEAVDRKTILVHEIARQYRPRMRKVRVVKIKEEVELEAYARKK